MTPVEKTRSTANTRSVYRTSDGEPVPGVTTIISLRAKPALVEWAFRIGKENPALGSLREYVDDLAEIGSCAHAILSAYLTGKDADLADYSANVVQAATVPIGKYLEWEKGHKIEILQSEKAYVSDLHRFGGTLDMLARIDGKITVLDFKTGSRIYDEHLYQGAAYAELAQENGGIKVDAVRILQIGRTGAEGFTERILTDWSLEWQWFLAMRAVYQVERDREYVARYGGREMADQGTSVTASGGALGIVATVRRGVANKHTGAPAGT